MEQKYRFRTENLQKSGTGISHTHLKEKRLFYDGNPVFQYDRGGKLWHDFVIGLFRVCENGQKRSRIVCMMALILLGQTLFVVTAGRQWLIYCYPFITHLPFVLFLHLSGVNFVWSLASVLIAYLCCQLRRWLALALVLCLGGRNADYQRVAEIVVTIPLLLLILRLAAPSIRSLSEHTRLSQCLFAIIPAAGYGFDYVTRIYTDLFASGSAVAMEFMPFLCSVLYLVLCSGFRQRSANAFGWSRSRIS